MRKYLYMNAFVAGMLLLAACGEKPAGKPAAPEIIPASVSVPADVAVHSVQVKAVDAWSLSADQSWVKFAPPGGNGSPDPVSVELRLSANKTGRDRSATVTLKTVSGQQATLSLTQTGASSGIVAGIATAADLVAFSEAVNEGQSLDRFYVNGAITLTADIDMTGVPYLSAGLVTEPFSRIFDGAGHTIKGISAPLFGTIRGATVRGLTYGVAGDRIAIEPVGDNRYGGIAASAVSSSFSDCTFGATLIAEKTTGHPRIGGLAGYLSSDSKMTACTNKGDVICDGEGLVGGLIGENEGEISECTNTGTVLAVRSSDGQWGPGWACGSNKVKAFFLKMKAGGRVGDYALYGSDPSKAPAGMYRNAVCRPKTNAFTLDGSHDQVTVDWTLDDYYAWTVVETKKLAEGLTWTKYDCDAVPRIVNVLEVDLKSTEVELTAAYADDIVPNPNGNGNNNNGYNKRETLSMLCTRKRAEGQDILAGMNAGFFDSNDGFGRGFHIEGGEPVFINNKSVQDRLTNHRWGFTVFTDGIASCGVKAFTGRLEVGGKQFSYYAVNDTILRHRNTTYPVNLYTARYKKTPHTGLTNPLAKNVVYVVAEYTGEPMKVNAGWAEAKVKAVYDGMDSPLSEAPYLSSSKEVAIATCTQEIGSLAKVGETLCLRCDITVDGVSRPIQTQISTMYQFLKDGKYDTTSVSATNTNNTTYDPVSFPVVSRDGTKVWLVEVDGRQEWFSLGLKAYEMARIAQKLGGYNMTRFDGGGSSCMWIYNASAGKGALVNRPCDSKGERSCMNYILVRKK